MKPEEVVSALGFINYEHFAEFKKNTVMGMIAFGDPFLRCLGEALLIAEDRDAVKIINLFRNECSVHEMLYKMHLAKKSATE